MTYIEGSRTVGKALSLFDYFTIERTKLTLSEMWALSALPPSTLFRLLTTLRQCGFLEYNDRTKQYSPGIKFIRLGLMSSEALDVCRISKSYMAELKKVTNETVSLFVRRGLYKVCISMVESDYAVRYAAKRGEEIPVYIGASGKVLLSGLDDDYIAGILEAIGFVWKTPNSDSSKDQVMEKIEFVRKNGYAMSWGERQVGSAGFGVPLSDFRGNVLASLNVSLPAERLRNDVLPKWIDALKNTGALISQKMGAKE